MFKYIKAILFKQKPIYVIETDFIKLWNVDELGMRLWIKYNGDMNYNIRLMTKEEINAHT